MKIRRKFLVGIFIISMACIILQSNKVNAALQSNGGTPTTKNVDDWMLSIRQMQELGGTLGRTDIVNNTDLTSTATDLDIHMEKNTEYGAMVILSASSYGNPSKINNGETTTGNSTGIVMNINKEWVAAGPENLSQPITLKNSVDRYKNIYSSTMKIGDAITETKGWHESKSSTWLSGAACGLIRSYSGSIYSYYGLGVSGGANPGYCFKTYSSRAAIVVGTGL